MLFTITQKNTCKSNKHVHKLYTESQKILLKDINNI